MRREIGVVALIQYTDGESGTAVVDLCLRCRSLLFYYKSLAFLGNPRVIFTYFVLQLEWIFCTNQVICGQEGCLRDS